MMLQAKAKMYLADERGLNETEWFRSLNTFNFGKYFSEHKQAPGDLYVLNDDTLDGGRSLNMLVEECSYVILLPVVGAIHYKDSLGNENLVAAGQVQLLSADKGVTIQISNPFREELVNFLQVWIKAGPNVPKTEHCVSTYNVNELVNNLIQISPNSAGDSSLPFAISIGKFSGRGEAVYQCKKNEGGVFLFVIEGVFEVEGRLLHARDGLALWDADEAGSYRVEMEALSNDAIILLIETPATAAFLSTYNK